jgi:hypothetical protein
VGILFRRRRIPRLAHVPARQGGGEGQSEHVTACSGLAHDASAAADDEPEAEERGLIS